MKAAFDNTYWLRNPTVIDERLMDYRDGRETGAVPLLREACVQVCVYGHLHGKDHKYGFQGEADGIRYHLASVDAIDFQPIPIQLA